MTEMEISYIFTNYIYVTIQRQAKAFFDRSYKIIYYEPAEFNVNCQNEEKLEENKFVKSYSVYTSIDERILNKEFLRKAFVSLETVERYIIFEKFFNNRSDADIGKEFSVSSQMISKRKRKILEKLKKFSLI